MKRSPVKKTIRQWTLEQQKERWRQRPSLFYPVDLPILQIKLELIQQIQQNQVLIIAAETGSGKSTQLPKILLEAEIGKHGKIACVQPRRIAATSIAKRIAFELKQPLGDAVGYRIRFDDQTQENTFIQIMTDGMLLSELHQDRYLSEYDAIIIDEAHERSLNIDLLLGLLKELLTHRPHFKVIIASATIDTQKFSEFFHNAPILHAKGRHFDVEIRYQEPKEKDEDILDQVSRALENLSAESIYGDILIFLPTEDFIKAFIDMAQKSQSKEKRLFLPLYARLSASEQQLIFQETDRRKIIVATNIAETSITLPNIHYVIDSGLARISQYSAQSRIQNLPIVAISQASANQRAGRCGRVSDGVCIRLYSEEDFLSRSQDTEPEIKRANLTETILRMLAMRINDPEKFDFIDKPHTRLFSEGFKTLFELQAIPSLKKSERQLTQLGHAMSHLPLDPRLSRMLIAANEEGALQEVTIIAAALSVMDMRSFPEEKKEDAKRIHQHYHSYGSDLLWYLNLHKTIIAKNFTSQSQLKRFCKEQYLHFMRVREWLSLNEQIGNLLKSKGYKPSELGVDRPWQMKEKNAASFPIGYTAIHRAVLTGYISNIGIYKPPEEVKPSKNKSPKRYTKQGSYLDTRMQEFTIFPASSLVNATWPWIFSVKLWRTSRLFARESAAIEPQWVSDLAKHLIQIRAHSPYYDLRRQEVVCTETHYLYSHAIAQYPLRSYVRHNAEQATLLFITQALTIPEVTEPLLQEELFAFLRHNMTLLQELQQSGAKLRRNSILIDDYAIVSFYQQRLKGIASVAALRQKILNNKIWGGTLFLQLEDLLIDPQLQEQLTSYPSRITIHDTNINLEYIFDPKVETDGVTAVLTPKQVEDLESEDPLLWHPPGLLKERISMMIKQLEKSHRIKLHPINKSVEHIINEIIPNGNFFHQLERFCYEHFHIAIPKEAWELAYQRIDPYLQIQLAVRYSPQDDNDLARSSTLQSLKKVAFSRVKPNDFSRLSQQWQEENINIWPSQHLLLPTVIDIEENGTVYGQAYPALVYDSSRDQIDLQLFQEQYTAEIKHRLAISKLLEQILKQELSALKKHYKIENNAPFLFYFANAKDATEIFHQYIKKNYLRPANIRSRDALLSYDTSDERARLWKSVAKDFSIYKDVLQLYDDLQQKIRKAQEKYQHDHIVNLRNNLELLAGKMGWIWMDTEKLHRLPALLKLWQIRWDRALAHLSKDKERATMFLAYYKKIHETINRDNTIAQEDIIRKTLHILCEVELKTFVPESKGSPYTKKELEESLITL
ncbi:ATP-dependent RNA helicase HrpA [Entomospira entomophila]|uniref:ATP-dependent RNA helicase HrpA n=1 Tax=Entomospira entomophila TaxID=2719988 RepID=A0A968G7W9_9SPIO|nr:ATP-dependent RNA helicase HrpA [Entomospira entomophilus]NIZ40220.1 ATP-dependent RNA helicase HrpA [Entomospira entomophilus]WDI35779.1 ATP-dependent RNA helicase HrpA [Entomospira entomophilus]